jgi:hypothetical protein
VLDHWHPELERYFEANYLIVNARALEWFDARRGWFNESNVVEIRNPVRQERPVERGP